MSPRGDDEDALWAAVADPTRRRLLDVILAHGEATATTIAGELPISRQAVAKHLAVLEQSGVVEGRRQGREVRYAVQSERLNTATRWMAELAAQWDERLSSIKRLAESGIREHHQEQRLNRTRRSRCCCRTRTR